LSAEALSALGVRAVRDLEDGSRCRRALLVAGGFLKLEDKLK